jgi:hypothetical protein
MNKTCPMSVWWAWRYQRGNQNPYIDEEHTTQWLWYEYIIYIMPVYDSFSFDLGFALDVSCGQMWHSV